MFKNITNFFSRKQKAIQEEIALKSKIDENLLNFIEENILKKSDIEYNLSYTFSKGVIKIETDNKLIAQEVAIRIKLIEDHLKSKGVAFKKLLI